MLGIKVTDYTAADGHFFDFLGQNLESHQRLIKTEILRIRLKSIIPLLCKKLNFHSDKY